MSEEDSFARQQQQEDEVEALKAMYPGDIEVAENTKNPKFTIALYPQRGSSAGAGGNVSLENVMTYVKLFVSFPPKYPKVIPKLEVKESKGLSAQEIEELSQDLKKTAEENVGEVMMYHLLHFTEEYLYSHQKKPTGSFHDEMLMRHKMVEERNLQQQMLSKEKERMAIKEQVLRKQEEMREEQRRIKEQWKAQNDIINNSSEVEGSPTKAGGANLAIMGDSLAGIIKPSGINRRKRRSLSNRRRRSNSEGSDSSLSENSDLVLLEFMSGKTLHQFYKGELIGRSLENNGTSVFAGMSKNGTMVAIYEWKFTLPTPDRRARGGSAGSGDVLTVEALTKQLQSLETESNYMTKLDHHNIVQYYGMKIAPSQDENGIVYLSLVEDFIRGFTVKSYLQDPQQLCSMALPLLRYIIHGTLEALRYLHDNNVAHRFMRDTSIFLSIRDEIKLCDYGIERKVSELYKSVHSGDLSDIPQKFPPSVGRGGKKGDVYRLGLIILSLLKGKYVDGPDIPQALPPELQDFLKRCLSTLEHNRWTAAELLDHPFIKMSIDKGPTIHLPDSPRARGSKDCEESQDEDLDPMLPPRIATSLLSQVPFSGHSRIQNEFQILEWLGKGGFGDVLKVRNKLDGRIYALKRIKLNPRNKQLNKKITREVKLLSQLNHENVVRYFNSWIETVEEDEQTETSTTDFTSTEPPTGAAGQGPVTKKNRSPAGSPVPPKEPSSVRFQLDKKMLNQNSLGILDNIEEMAPPASGDSEWSVSLSRGQSRGGNDDDDLSEDSCSDEVDLFGTSFLRLANADSEDDDAIIFESDGRSRNGTSETDDTAEDSFRGSRSFQQVEISLNDGKKNKGNKDKNKNNSKNNVNAPSPDSLRSGSSEPRHVEAQYMYIQMEFCEKSTLRTAIDDNLFEDIDRAWRLFREIVEGLVHIHQQGMIHRDLKPVNIFLDSHDHVKIGDFGLATCSILPKCAGAGLDLLHDKLNEPEGGHLKHSVDFGPEESQTGQVGTALYVAPELMMKTMKVMYNQKVDIYSLGIIFFEMFSRPLTTSMERVRVISALRQPSVTFPVDFDQSLMPQVTHITKWLLNHDPGQRPTSLELLQSDYLPPPHLEEAELRDIFSRTLKNSQSKAYKFLIASCFLQTLSPVEDYTFDMENTRFPPNAVKNLSVKYVHFCNKLKHIVQSIFEKHGGLEVGTPLLMPKSQLYEGNECSVSLMSHSGNLVSLPHDLRVPFARFIGRQGIRHMKRFAIEKVFRERKIFGLHPRELVECAFDIISCTPGSLITDAEILSIALEIVQELPWLRNKTCTIRLGHTKLLEGLLIHHGIDTKYHNQIKKTLAEIKVDCSSSKQQIQAYLCGKGLPDHFITMLFSLMEVEGSLPKVSNILKSVTKRKCEAASLIKAGLHELEILLNHVEHLGLKCGVVIAPTMVFASHIYTGLLFQVVCNLRRRKNKMTVDVIAAGGRYDALIESFRSALLLECDPTTSSAKPDPCSQCGVGISISFDKLIAAYDGEDCSDWNRQGTVHAVIYSAGHHPRSKEKLELMKELWARGVKCTVLECSQTLEEAEEQCKDSGAQFMLILKENEIYSDLRVKLWEKEMFRECKMSRQDALELISKRVNEANLASDGGVGGGGGNSGSSGSSIGINRSDSLISKLGGGNSLGISMMGMGSSDSNQSSAATTNSFSQAFFSISFVVQEREKLATWKKRYENQVMHHISDTLPKLAKQQHVEVLGLDVNRNVINTLAASLINTDREEYYKGVSDAVEKHPKLKKYLQNICDEIYELWFEKNVSVIILYGLIDNSYRVLL